MFKFSFDGSGKRDDLSATSQSTRPNELVAKEEFYTPTCTHSNSPYDCLVLCDGKLKLRKAVASPAHKLSPAGADIIPYTYEGGYKLWEGAVDLVEYLFAKQASIFKGKRVLELGAGHAFPSILAARFGAAHIDITDYNVEVLHEVTMPNIAANVQSPDVQVRYFSGGWQSLPDILEVEYDIILSAETVYAANQSKCLAECLLRTLGDRGTAFVAAKSYYFGVGGGARAFEKDIRSCAARFEMSVTTKVVREIRDGLSNVREIMQIQRK